MKNIYKYLKRIQNNIYIHHLKCIYFFLICLIFCDDAHLLKAMLKHSVIFNFKLILLKWQAKRKKANWQQNNKTAKTSKNLVKIDRLAKIN